MQLATIFAVVSYEAHVPLITALLVQAFIYLAAALTVASGVHYVIVVRSRYAHTHMEEVPAAPPGATSPHASNDARPTGASDPHARGSS